MTIDELIGYLAGARSISGDLKLTTWDGDVSKITLGWAKDGVMCDDPKEANELTMDIETRDPPPSKYQLDDDGEFICK